MDFLKKKKKKALQMQSLGALLSTVVVNLIEDMTELRCINMEKLFPWTKSTEYLCPEFNDSAGVGI